MLVRVLAALLLLLPSCAGALAADEAPDAVAKAFYAGYAKRLDGPYEALDAYRLAALAPDLAKTIVAIDKAAAKAGDAGIDFDYIIDAQDFDTMSKLSAKTLSQSGDAATVKVSYVMFGPTTMTLKMKKIGGRWKIDDIVYGDRKETLRDVVAAVAKEYL